MRTTSASTTKSAILVMLPAIWYFRQCRYMHETSLMYRAHDNSKYEEITVNVLSQSNLYLNRRKCKFLLQSKWYRNSPIHNLFHLLSSSNLLTLLVLCLKFSSFRCQARTKEGCGMPVIANIKHYHIL